MYTKFSGVLSIKYPRETEIPDIQPVTAASRAGRCLSLLSDKLQFVDLQFAHSCSLNPTNAVGGSFILNLHGEPWYVLFPNPTNAVGGLFILNLQADDAR